jgi:hypothetical protein
MSSTVVVAICRLPSDNVVIFSGRIERLRKAITADEHATIEKTYFVRDSDVHVMNGITARQADSERQANRIFDDQTAYCNVRFRTDRVATPYSFAILQQV